MQTNARLLPLPVAEADITSDWFAAALNSSGHDASGLQSITVQALSDLGFMCDIFRVTPSWTDESPAGLPGSFVVKVPPSDRGGHEVGTMLNAWAREGEFYRHVAPRSPGVKLPACYFTGEDVAAGRWVLVLEELPTDGVTDSLGATVPQAEAALVALANFHGSWWQASHRFEWMPGFDRRGVGGLQPLWLQAIPTFLERYGHLIPPETAVWLTAFAPQLQTWSDHVATQPLTIVHADFRTDNLIFRGDNVTLIDWQTAMRGPAAMDVASFLATSVTTEERRSNERHLIDTYLAALSDNGVDVDPQDFARSLDENLLWWMGQFANNLAHLHPPAPAQARLDLMITRTFQMAYDRQVGRIEVAATRR